MRDDFFAEEADRVHDFFVRYVADLHEGQHLVDTRVFVHLDRLDTALRIADAKRAVFDQRVVVEPPGCGLVVGLGNVERVVAIARGNIFVFDFLPGGPVDLLDDIEIPEGLGNRK